MVWKLKLRKKKEDGEKKKGLEESLKAKIKATQLQERYGMMKSLIASVTEGQEYDASKLLKAFTIATQGLGEVGDKNRPNNEALEGCQELLEFQMLDEIDHGKDSEVTKVDGVAIIGAFYNLCNRSLRREHTDVEIVLLPELYGSDYARRSERTSTLEK